MSNEQEKLSQIRTRIDTLDEQIQLLINQRAACAEEVAQIKRNAGEETHFYRPEREAEVLRRVKARNTGPLPAEEMARLFREIMSACLAHEQPLSVAYLGPEGTFTQAAALKHFGHSVSTHTSPTIDDVFREVESGTCHYGVVPVENSTEGVVNHTLDCFLTSALKICGEVNIRIHHCLLSNSTDLGNIKRIYSHQQSLGQCRKWLDARLPGVERISVSSNAEAARLCAAEPGSAAIASREAAIIYQLAILAENIEDQPDNTTRFLVIGQSDVERSGDDKTSLLISTNNRPGALYSLLMPFAESSISLSRIESRPSKRGVWEYVFFIDVDGHRNDPELSQVLEKLQQQASLFKLLGSYPRAVL